MIFASGTDDYLSSRTVKKAVSRVCFGCALYQLTLYAAMIYESVIGSAILYIVPADSYDYMASFIDGVIALTSVLVAAVAAWIYFHSRAEKGLLYGEKSLPQVVFGGVRIAGIRRMAVFIMVLYVCQIASNVTLIGLEAVLNMAGLTAMNSPASTADYSVSFPTMAYAVIIGPMIEEIIFRGLILKGLKPYGRVYAIIVSSAMFSLMHGDISQIIFTFIVGLMLGYVATEYSIFASYLLHVINNGGFSLVLGIIESIAGETFSLILFYALAIPCFIIVAVYVRKHWDGIKSYLRPGNETAPEMMGSPNAGGRPAYETAPGAVSGLINPWFIAYTLIMLVMTVMTITPLV